MLSLSEVLSLNLYIIEWSSIYIYFTCFGAGFACGVGYVDQLSRLVRVIVQVFFFLLQVGEGLDESQCLFGLEVILEVVDLGTLVVAVGLLLVLVDWIAVEVGVVVRLGRFEEPVVLEVRPGLVALIVGARQNFLL